MCNRVACMHAPNSKRPSSIKHCRFQAFRDGFCYWFCGCTHPSSGDVLVDFCWVFNFCAWVTADTGTSAFCAFLWFKLFRDKNVLPSSPCAVISQMSEEVFQLQEALRMNQLQIKNALQRRRHRKKREASGGLGPAGQKATIAVYLLSDQNLELSVRMLQHWAAAASPSSMDPGRIVEDLVLQTPMETLRQTFAPETQEWRLAVARAKKFLAEATARDWVAQLNVGHGVAPSATEVYWQYESVLKGTDPEARLPAARMVRKWVCCWRGRWGVRRGAIRPKLHIETPLLQAKALGIVASRVSIFFPFRGHCG